MIDKLIPIFIGILCCIALFIGGFISGSNKVKVEWQEERLQTNSYIADLRQQYDVKLQEYISKNDQLITEIQEKSNEYQKTIDSLNATHANELFKSEQRVEIYKRMSAKDNCKSDSLSTYSARLDSSLTEGRSVVRQLRALIELRDNQLRELGKQLLLLTEVQ